MNFYCYNCVIGSKDIISLVVATSNTIQPPKECFVTEEVIFQPIFAPLQRNQQKNKDRSIAVFMNVRQKVNSYNK